MFNSKIKKEKKTQDCDRQPNLKPFFLLNDSTTYPFKFLRNKKKLGTHRQSSFLGEKASTNDGPPDQTHSRRFLSSYSTIHTRRLLFVCKPFSDVQRVAENWCYKRPDIKANRNEKKVRRTSPPLRCGPHGHVPGGAANGVQRNVQALLVP